MQGSATGEEEVQESIPAQLGRRARQSVDSARATAEKSLADLQGKTNGIIDKAQGALDGFVEKVQSTKTKVIGGIDTAIGAIETPLLALAPLLREAANTGINTVFGAAEGIPATVTAKVKSVKDPLISEIQKQVDSIADQAVSQVSSVEGQIGSIKDKLLSMADEQLDGLVAKVDEVGKALPEKLDVVID
ncbi:MAG: hypothetical protein H6703_12480, partial [Myxococcales bacterium]|nr:hypothetical protein [Myxococcales bacterium]